MKKIDIQSQEDKRKVTIDKVGVKNVRYPIIVEDRVNGFQNTVADLNLFVELPHRHAGRHQQALGPDHQGRARQAKIGHGRPRVPFRQAEAALGFASDPGKARTVHSGGRLVKRTEYRFRDTGCRKQKA